MLTEINPRLSKGEHLTPSQATQVMDFIMTGQAEAQDIGTFLLRLQEKGPTIDEITAFAQVLRNRATKLSKSPKVLEIVGTGGDKSNTFNISTTSALVVAAAGVPVAKHGNRASSSQCGSADVLEALGVKIDLEPERSLEILEEIGLCFLFAQRYHSAMVHVAKVRKELNVPTVFNILGPLCHPLQATHQLMGVYRPDLVEPLARVLANLGVERGMVVHGTDGLDEISMTAPTQVCEINKGEFLSYTIDPRDYGFSLCNKEDLVGGSPQENAQITRAIFAGEQSPRRDAVVLNSAAALYIAQEGITLETAIGQIKSTIDTGKAEKKLQDFISVSNQ